MHFQNYRLRKTLLDKCRKSPVSKDSWTGNVVNGPRHSFNLNDSTFTVFINYSKGN